MIFIDSVDYTTWVYAGFRKYIFAIPMLVLFYAIIIQPNKYSFINKITNNKLINYLGKISFPLYLIQIPIICSFSSFLYLKLPGLGFTIVTSNIINLFLTIFLCLITATFLLPLEKFSIIYSKKIGKIFIR